MGKTNANKVLGTFRKNYDDRKKSMMKSYNMGGINEQICTGWNGKRGCKEVTKFKSEGKSYNPNSVSNMTDSQYDNSGYAQKKKFTKKVKNVGNALDNMPKKTKYAVGIGAALTGFIASQIAKAKRKNG